MTNSDSMIIARNIASLREHSGYTVAALGSILDLADSAIKQWEIGITRPSPAMMLKLAEALRCSPVDIDPRWKE